MALSEQSHVKVTIGLAISFIALLVAGTWSLSAARTELTATSNLATSVATSVQSLSATAQLAAMGQAQNTKDIGDLIAVSRVSASERIELRLQIVGMKGTLDEMQRLQLRESKK